VTTATDTQQLFKRLADRDKVRSEATVQADVRSLLLLNELGLQDQDLEVELETQVGDRRRIDVEVGFTVIEVKRDLRTVQMTTAEQQLAGYVKARSTQTGQRYVGILTDGAEWIAYQFIEGSLHEAVRHTLNPTRPDPAALFSWLEGVLATRTHLPPTPAAIADKLGATSTSHALDRDALRLLYQANANLPTVRLKRELWASLLRSALGTQFTDDDELFIEHTLLVNSAELIAHLVLGLDVSVIAPASLLRGGQFETAGVFGVVEQDFFDWVIEVPGGEPFIRTLGRRLSRFDWSQVEHDVLKVLYESVISTDTRKKLGEYYTPDWLAEQVVETAVTDPLNQRILDPSCGSGTFLFHCVRRYLAASQEAGQPLSDALKGLPMQVMGLDLHPVAVALARVTYLLAIGRQRLVDEKRGPIRVPVYLGDSVQWQQRADLLSDNQLVIPTETGGQLFSSELRFPDHLLKDASRFDQLVTALAEQAGQPRGTGTPSLPAGLVNRLAISAEDKPLVEENFRLLCRLHDEGRNHIWSYYVRNLARPLWLSQTGNRVDVLVGNPPWLSYRHMPQDMQATFREMSISRGLWHGHEVATHQDLSGLFIARAAQQYLADDGTFAFVVPNAVLDRSYFEGFRAGRYDDQEEGIAVGFTGTWDLRRLRPHFFPRGAAVVFGQRRPASNPIAMSASTERWTGKLPRGTDTWETVHPFITREPAVLAVHDDSIIESPYEPRFGQGATAVPRMTFVVEVRNAGPLGLAGGQKSVRSYRSASEKAPWKYLDPLEGAVEPEFLKPLLVSECILPFRTTTPRPAVIPLEGTTLLNGNHSRIDLYPGLASWWRQAEALWIQHRSSEKLTLEEQLNYRNKLTDQVPGTDLRVVYAASGMHAVASLLEDPTAIIDKSVYWATVANRAEAMYLLAILNSPSLTDLVRPLMSYGKDERHIDKHVWKLPIPLYEGANDTHAELATLGEECAWLAGTLDIRATTNHVKLRQEFRAALSTNASAKRADEIVQIMLDQ
jgi:SAM-dependent methyltransferase